MVRANYIPAPHFFELNQACRMLTEAFGYHVYLVGSSIERRDYRDVDIRCILPDKEYARMFGEPSSASHARNAMWSLMCSSISLWLSRATGLPIDFQIQQQTQANAEFAGTRCAIGIFLHAKREEEAT
jgi:hypothetical protein